MNWQSFIQWFFIIASSGSIFGAFLAWASRKNGKETRALLKELHEKTISVLKELHEETISVLDRIDKRAEERHKEMEARHGTV
jgi:hypothetical protein